MPTVTVVTASLREKEIQRIKDKLENIRSREKALDTLSEGDKEARKIERSITTLDDQVTTLQTNILGNYPIEFVQCRDTGHLWKVKSDNVESGRLFRVLVCSRCSTVREEIISKYGGLLQRTYTHPDGYTLSSVVKGMVGYSKEFWRGIIFTKAKTKA